MKKSKRVATAKNIVLREYPSAYPFFIWMANKPAWHVIAPPLYWAICKKGAKSPENSWINAAQHIKKTIKR